MNCYFSWWCVVYKRKLLVVPTGGKEKKKSKEKYIQQRMEWKCCEACKHITRLVLLWLIHRLASNKFLMITNSSTLCIIMVSA